ncbi:MAG: hydrogenase maturation nickel metallochaperone HypA [Bacteroidales bacterium]|jgi:hydrogenase nickel incorporation protein HypA/HybF|nr:hydrogenase maturation nickel metallochaperone HypA [Bacteroidales bacterium]
MHELSIAEDLSAIVLETALRETLAKVTRVNVSIGQLVQIVPGLFESAFIECVRDTVAGQAELCIEIVPVRMKCRKCGADIGIEDNNFSCSACGSDDLEMINGRELYIKSIEGE